jgi:hypothetical protein
MAGDVLLIWGRRKPKYFCEQDWTGGIKLICFKKSGFARKLRRPEWRPGGVLSIPKNATPPRRNIIARRRWTSPGPLKSPRLIFVCTTCVKVQ